MLILTTMLVAITVPGPSTSYLLDLNDEHEHEWVQTSDEDKGTAWIDVNWRKTYRHESIDYPSILIRYELKEEGKPFGMGEMALAVDCKGKAMAIYDGWIEEYAKGELRSRPKEPLGFNFATEPFDNNELFLYKHACGPDWTP